MGCSILPHWKDLHIENSVEDVLVVVVVEVEVKLIDNSVHFGTYHRLDFDHQS